MTRILGVMGSPRKRGNTHTLMTEVQRGVVAVGGSMDIVLLKGLAIAECEGCLSCWKGKECARDDDMNALYPRIVDCDALVFGTPVYWYGPTALMKAFIDRFVYFNCDENRAKIIGKRAAVVVPYEETDPDTVAPVIDFFSRSLRYLQMRLVSQVTAPGVSKRGEVKNDAETMVAAFDLGRLLVNGTDSP